MKSFTKQLLVALAVIILFSFSAKAQYKFEGTALNPQNYSQIYPGATVHVYVFGSCSATGTGCQSLPSTEHIYTLSGTQISSNELTATSANGSDPGGYWGFLADTNRYDVKITVSGSSVAFRWLGFLGASGKTGYYNVKDFGAVGTGSDDTLAVASAIYFIGASNGGTLFFPQGYYAVGNSAVSFNGITLPSGIIIQGTNPASNSNCVIALQAGTDHTNVKSLFKIGELTNRVTIRDIKLSSTSFENTIAVAASGAEPPAPTTTNPNPPPTSSAEFMFSNMTVSGFDKGISIVATDSHYGWQCNNVRIDHCTFGANYGIYTDTINTDMQISNVQVNVKPGGSGIYIRHGGFLLIENTIGNGNIDPVTLARAANFIYLAAVNTVQIENSECEEFTNAVNIEYPTGVSTVGFPTPITLINNAFGLPVLLNRDVSLVSIGNWYCDQTVQATSTTTHVDIYSVGDRACVDSNWSLPGQSQCTVPSNGVCDPFNVSGSNKIAFRSGQKGLGVGTSKPGDSMSGAESVVEIETKTSGTLPWLVLKGPGATHERWGWTVSGGKLYLQDIGSSNILTIDENGNLNPVPAYPATSRGSLGATDKRWATVYAVDVHATNLNTGDTILRDKNTGVELYRIREDENTIIFEDIRTGKEMMRIGRDGNLYVKGRVFQNTDYNQAMKRVKRAPGRSRRARR